jgi:hypothetical protein
VLPCGGFTNCCPVVVDYARAAVCEFSWSGVSPPLFYALFVAGHFSRKPAVGDSEALPEDDPADPHAT